MDSIRQHIRENHVLERMENKIEHVCPGYGSHFQVRIYLIYIDKKNVLSGYIFGVASLFPLFLLLLINSVEGLFKIDKTY